jgi:hypothetical protein
VSAFNQIVEQAAEKMQEELGGCALHSGVCEGRVA